VGEGVLEKCLATFSGNFFELGEVAEEKSSLRASGVNKGDTLGHVARLSARFHSHSEKNKTRQRVLQNWEQRLCFNITFQYLV